MRRPARPATVPTCLHLRRGVTDSAPRAVAEQALVHVNTNRVEAAYMRSDLFEQRRELMEAWGDNLAQTERAERAGSG